MACARVPLDEQQVTEGPKGRERTLPALHPERKEDRCFMLYQPPPEDASPAQVEEFLEHAQFISEDLEWLLALPHDKFWCQVVFDESLQKCLDSYLRNAPRGTDCASLSSSPAVAEMQRSLHRSVFMVFLRMATHKESKDNFITPAVFGEIIYDNFLFDIPKILDLCDLADLILYLCDTCTTIHSFLDIFPEACPTFHQHGFLNRLSSFYEAAVPDLEKAVIKRNFDKCLQEDLWRRVCHSRRRMVEITHLLLQHTCLQPILEGSEHTASFVEDFLQTFTAFLQEKRFLADYDELFPVADDISLLQQAFPHLDDTRTSYLLQAVESAWDSTGKKRPVTASSANQSRDTGSKTSWDTAPAKLEAAGGGATAGAEFRGAEAMMDIPRKGSNVSLNAVVVSHGVLLIQCILFLAPVNEVQPPVITSRSNVFDDDEFDVFNRDQVDMSRVWKGRRKGESVREMLNDKRHVDEQRDRYRSYQTVVDEIPITSDPAGNQGGAYGFDDYDDEYDDTYDINQVGANDLDEDDELLNRRPFTTPQVLSMGRKGEEEEEEGEEEEDAVKRDQFVQDPAVLRERAEARRLAMQNRRGYRPPPQSNVVGGPKGRGQTQETTQDRRRKEMNKSRGVNHNRRAMADRKRNKGMIPS
uniref:Activating signal cointegrator 1 complex subunit 2 n=1 Tax=Astyanax mexicanus TaxID=7994 RepID=A0A8B9K9M9_ASTMX